MDPAVAIFLYSVGVPPHAPDKIPPFLLWGPAASGGADSLGSSRAPEPDEGPIASSGVGAARGAVNQTLVGAQPAADGVDGCLETPPTAEAWIETPRGLHSPRGPSLSMPKAGTTADVAQGTSAGFRLSKNPTTEGGAQSPEVNAFGLTCMAQRADALIVPPDPREIYDNIG